MATEFVVTPEFTLSFPALAKMDPGLLTGKESPDEIDKKLRYRVTALFDAGADLGGLRELAGKAALATWPQLAKVPATKSLDPMIWPAGLRSPFHSGNGVEWGEQDISGRIFIRATTLQAVTLVGRRREPLSVDHFYAGCRCRAMMNMWAYNVSANKGISAGFCAIQKIADGERLDTAAPDIDGFEEYEDAATAGFFA